jgi:DsbC/DsbD-like thiol-disulfide interchange protein
VRIRLYDAPFMTPASRFLACTLLFIGLGSGCGGAARPEPSQADDQARRDRERRKAEAEQAKAAKLAKLDSSDLADRPQESVVQVSFEPLVTGVRPGQKFLLAAHFRIAPGYRISWTNPGEVGKETVVTVQAPSGFEVGTPRFPVPERYTVPGGYTGFGYQGETAIFVEVKAPPSLPRSRVHRFDLAASWVACKKECANERIDAYVELATTYGNANAKEVEANLAPFKARLPTPLANVKDAEQEWDRSTLVVNIPGAEPREFWLGAQAEPAPKKVNPSGSELRLVFGEKPGPEANPVRGLVIATAGGKDAFYELDATPPEETKEMKKKAKHVRGK